jgi:hypothetical protein
MAAWTPVYCSFSTAVTSWTACCNIRKICSLPTEFNFGFLTIGILVEILTLTLVGWMMNGLWREEGVVTDPSTVYSISAGHHRICIGLDWTELKQFWSKICDDGTLAQVLCFWTLSIVLFSSETPSVFVSKHNVSETGFCLLLQVETTQLGPIDKANTYRRTTNKNKLRGFSPQANYTDRATAACRWN